MIQLLQLAAWMIQDLITNYLLNQYPKLTISHTSRSTAMDIIAVRKLAHSCEASGIFPNNNDIFTQLRAQEFKRRLPHRNSDYHLPHPLVLSSSTSCFFRIILSLLTRQKKDTYHSSLVYGLIGFRNFLPRLYNRRSSILFERLECASTVS